MYNFKHFSFKTWFVFLFQTSFSPSTALCSVQCRSAGLPLPRWCSVPHRRLNENMWTVFPEGLPTMLITLTWILWRQTILQTAGDQSKPTWNMPPATFTLGSMLFKMEHFHFICDYFTGKVGLLMGPQVPNDLFLPPLPPPLSRAVVKGRREGVRFTLSCL